jgi:L-arabinose isomerase
MDTGIVLQEIIIKFTNRGKCKNLIAFIMSSKSKKFENANAGLLLIASPRFKNLGEGLKRGSYSDRKNGTIEGVIDTLKENINIVFPGIVYSSEEMQNAMVLFFKERVDFVIVEFLSWSEDFAWIRFLRDMPGMPILFVNPVKDSMTFKDTLDEDDFVDFLCSGTLVGSLEASGSIPRIGRNDIKIVIGSREEILDQVLCFSRAAKIRSVLRQATIGLLANFNELMWSTYIDPYNLFARIGPELRYIAYSTLADQINEVSDTETKKYQNELVSRFRVANDLDERKFFESVRASIGLAKLTESMNIDAMVFNDLDQAMFKLVGLRPGFYHPSLNQNLSVLVPEADVGAGVIVFIMKILTGKHINFIEPFHIEASDNSFAGGHAGPNDHNDIDYANNVIIARDVRFAKTKYKYAGAPFAWYRIPPGRKTMAHFSENNGTYKIVCTLVDSLEGKHILVSYSHSVFKPVVPVKELFEKILKIGTTQHFALVDGDYRAELSILSEIMGFDYHEIV